MASRDNRVHVRAWSGRAGFRFSENQPESGLVTLVTRSFHAVIRALTSVHAREMRVRRVVFFFFNLFFPFSKFRINRMEEEEEKLGEYIKVTEGKLFDVEILK